MVKDTHWNYLRTIILGLAGFCFGPFILSIDNNPLRITPLRFGCTPQAIHCLSIPLVAPCTAPEKFVCTPEFWVWLMTIGGQTALWFVLVLPLWRDLPPGGIKNNKRQFAGLIGSLGILTAIIMLIRPGQRPLNWHEIKMGFLQFCGLATALLAIQGIGLIYRKLDDGSKEAEGVENLLNYKQKLEQLLLAAGTIIGAATLATGALRSALLAHFKTEEVIGFPKEYVLLYGLIYSMFLAAVYLPVHLKLQKKGKELRDQLIPLPESKPESWAAWYSNRKAFDDLLQLQLNPVASLFSGISILTPLAGSIVGLLIGK